MPGRYKVTTLRELDTLRHRIRTDFRNVETGFVDGIILSHPNS